MGHAVVLAIDMYRGMCMLEHVHVNVEGERMRELKNLQMRIVVFVLHPRTHETQVNQQSAVVRLTQWIELSSTRCILPTRTSIV